MHIKSQPIKTRLKRYLLSSIGVDWLIETQLLLLTFSTGMQDAISFPDFHCFASNQTGNSVILAVGLAGQGGDLFDIKNVGVSLAVFVSGALVTGQIARIVGPRLRVWLFVTHLMQTVMGFGAAILQATYGPNESGPSALGAISLLAFSSSAQVASMRPFRIQEITTAMATAAWVDLVIDPKLLAMNNHPRDRRALFLGILIAGSFAGAFAHRRIGSSNTLIIAAAIKLLVTVSLLANRSISDGQESQD
ncbi:hypothetical protein H2204_006220 [Knufia peltigerae]|uniref:DUF1275 domain protein n=1 Tax=Knufia peltigerae TaxID=1002370 RepID=A0AA39CYY2_9EURO|nr:hypothetical protein H2204_006220 [Knufia peltigerae]